MSDGYIVSRNSIAIKKLEAENASLKEQLIGMEVKRDVAVGTVEQLREQRNSAQQALAEQCKETKALKEQVAQLNALKLFARFM